FSDLSIIVGGPFRRVRGRFGTAASNAPGSAGRAPLRDRKVRTARRASTLRPGERATTRLRAPRSRKLHAAGRPIGPCRGVDETSNGPVGGLASFRGLRNSGQSNGLIHRGREPLLLPRRPSA